MGFSGVPSMNSLAFLVHEAPCFALRGCKVKVITEPSTFFAELCCRAAAAEKRITLSTLYLGTGEKERQLVSNIQQGLEERPGLRVKVLLDYCRGNRITDGQSSCSLLQGLVDEHQVCGMTTVIN